jgi:MscS family membrane protein
LIYAIPGLGDEEINPLSPPDTSSARATIQSFNEIMTEAVQIYFEDKDPDSITITEQLIGQAGKCFDLSKVKPVNVRLVAYETSILIYDVFNRIDIPPYEDIPDASQMNEDGLTSWTIPGTEITVALVEEGNHKGEYLFTTSTVELAAEFYKLTRSFPNKRGIVERDIFEIYEMSSGTMVPEQLIDVLPNWMRGSVFGQVVWKWIGITVVLIIYLLFVYLLYRLERMKKWDGSKRAFLRRLIFLFLVIVLTTVLKYIAWGQLNVISNVYGLITYLDLLIKYLAAAWIMWHLLRLITEALILSPWNTVKKVEPNLLRTMARVLGIFFVLVLFLEGANYIGLPVVGLIAGLGIGGLAIALAAQSTIENFIGGIALLFDRPVVVGDFCRFGDKTGTIEEIGLRSTRIRGLDRAVTTIPNKEFANMEIVNLNKRYQMLLRTTINLRYETTPDQLRLILSKFKELLVNHSQVSNDPARVRFIGLGEYSLNVEVFAYIQTSKWDTFLEIREELLLRMMHIVNDAGSGFAFPSQTTYFTHDAGLDSELQNKAEAELLELLSQDIETKD